MRKMRRLPLLESLGGYVREPATDTRIAELIGNMGGLVDPDLSGPRGFILNGRRGLLIIGDRGEVVFAYGLDDGWEGGEVINPTIEEVEKMLNRGTSE